MIHLDTEEEQDAKTVLRAASPVPLHSYTVQGLSMGTVDRTNAFNSYI